MFQCYYYFSSLRLHALKQMMGGEKSNELEILITVKFSRLLLFIDELTDPLISERMVVRRRRRSTTVFIYFPLSPHFLFYCVSIGLNLWCMESYSVFAVRNPALRVIRTNNGPNFGGNPQDPARLPGSDNVVRAPAMEEIRYNAQGEVRTFSRERNGRRALADASLNPYIPMPERLPPPPSYPIPPARDIPALRFPPPPTYEPPRPAPRYPPPPAKPIPEIFPPQANSQQRNWQQFYPQGPLLE